MLNGIDCTVRRTRNVTQGIAWCIAVAVALAACTEAAPRITEASPPPAPRLEAGGTPHQVAVTARSALFAGNTQGMLAAPTLPPPGAPLAPFVEARLYAIVNVAMHDALNAIVPRFDRYADQGRSCPTPPLPRLF